MEALQTEVDHSAHMGTLEDGVPSIRTDLLQQNSALSANAPAPNGTECLHSKVRCHRQKSKFRVYTIVSRDRVQGSPIRAERPGK